MPKSIVPADGEALSNHGQSIGRRTFLKAAVIAGATPAAAWAPAAPDANSQASLHSLIGQHARLWAIDMKAWEHYGDLDDTDAMNARPLVRVKVSQLITGRGAGGKDIKTPIYAHTVEEIDACVRRNRQFRVIWYGNHGNPEHIAKIEASCVAQGEAWKAELAAILEERQRIEDACGYTVAKERAEASSEAVKAVERQIIDIEPVDLETARLKALWVANSYETNVGYLDDKHLLDALKAIGRSAA